MPAPGACEALVVLQTDSPVSAPGSRDSAVPVSVSCKVKLAAPPEGMDALAAALAGVSELEWLEHGASLAASQPARLSRMLPGFARDEMEAFFTWWRSLDRLRALEVWARSEDFAAEIPFPKLIAALREYARARVGARSLQLALASRDAFCSLDEWVRERLAEFAGSESWEAVCEGVLGVLRLRDLIYEQAPLAVEQILLRRVSQNGHGDEKALREALAEPVRLIVCLPFLRRREWSRRREAVLGGVAQVEPDGTIAVMRREDVAPASRNFDQAMVLLALAQPSEEHPVATGRMSFSDERTVPGRLLAGVLPPVLAAYGLGAEEVARRLGDCLAPRKDEISVSLSISLPACAAACWRRAPSEKDPAFFTTYSGISVAVQKTLRTWLPYLHFSQGRHYEMAATAVPLLVYAASEPFPGKPKQEFVYDVLNEQRMAQFFRTAAKRLPNDLEQRSRWLRAAGSVEAAARYVPARAGKFVEAQAARPRAVMRFVAAEAWIVNALVNLGCRLARETPDRLDPVLLAENLVKDLHARLRKLHAGQDFLEAVPLILIAATSALSAASGQPLWPELTLRLRAPELDVMLAAPAVTG
ncbi:MAG TPA: hypothetical protein VNJ11_16165 [Bryobacteraceae bacterium]|nr:hypothetical protein [Bryobacteraceae bacterium]